MVESAPVGPDEVEGGITLVLGPPNAGKLGWVIRWWETERHLDPVIVVPTWPDVPLVTREVVERVGAVLGGRPVVTFDRLATDVWRRSPGLGPVPRVLDDVGRRLVLARALTLAAAPRLAPLLDTAGGIDALGDLVREMQGSGVAPENVTAALRDLGARSDLGTRSDLEIGGDLAVFVETYRGLLRASGRAEREDLIRGALPAAGLWRRPVACYGFVSFTPLQRMLLRRLALTAPVVLSLVDDPGRRWSAYFAAEVAHWVEGARSIERLDREARAYSSPQIARLERSFLDSLAEGGARGARPDPAADPASGPEADPPAPSDSSEPSDRGSGVRFLLASGRTAEAELVVRHVVTLMRDGVPADQIGLLVRDVRPWHKVLSRTLRAYGVPFRIDGEVDLVETGLGAALLSLVRGLSEGALEPLLAYARSPYCPAETAIVDRLESEVRGARVVDGRSLIDVVLRALPAGSPPLQSIVRYDLAGRPVVDLGALRSQAEHMVVTAAGGRSLESLGSEEDVAALDTVTDTLEEISRAVAAGWLREPAPVEAGGAVRPDRLWESVTDLPPVPLVMGCLRSARVLTGRGDDRLAVRVMSVRRARARRFQAVFLLGLTDGEFPRSERVPALLTARQRMAVDKALGQPLFPDPPAGEDVGLFALALSRPWQVLCLSGRDSEDGGEPVSVSPYWEEAMRCLGIEKPEAGGNDRRTLSEVVHPVEAAPTVREFLRACAVAGIRLPGPMGARLAESSQSWDCRPTRLGAQSLDRLAARQEFRVTEIEQYAVCPFAWFIDGSVGLEDMEDRLDDRTLGSVLHRGLGHLYASLRDEGLLPLRAAALPRGEELASAAVDRSVRELRPPGSPGELRLLRHQVGSRMRAALEADVAAGGRLVPSRFEYALPPGGVDIGGARITGRIDRIDEGPSGEPSFVIDYKSSTGGSAAPFDSPRSVQVRLYLLALRTHDPLRGLAGGAYLYLGGPVVKGVVVADYADDVGARIPSGRSCTAEEFDDLLERAREVALGAVQGIRQGLIPAEPADKCPGFCELRPLCRTKSGPRRW